MSVYAHNLSTPHAILSDDALSLHINTDDGVPVVWLAGLIAPRDWLIYGERISAALLDAKEVR